MVLQWLLLTGIIQQAHSQFCPGICGSWYHEDLVETNRKHFMFDFFKHDVGLPSRWRQIYLDAENFKSQQCVVQGVRKSSFQPVISWPQSKDVSHILWPFAMYKTLTQNRVGRI